MNLARTLILAALASQLGGCAAYIVQMRLTSDTAGPDYVLLRDDGERIYDCYSKPNGTDWDPTCVKVKLKASAGSSDD